MEIAFFPRERRNNLLSAFTFLAVAARSRAWSGGSGGHIGRLWLYLYSRYSSGFIRLFGSGCGALCRRRSSFDRGFDRSPFLRRTVKEIENNGTDSAGENIQGPARNKDDIVISLGEIGGNQI